MAEYPAAGERFGHGVVGSMNNGDAVKAKGSQ
jgi:hypothetical protein